MGYRFFRDGKLNEGVWDFVFGHVLQPRAVTGSITGKLSSTCSVSVLGAGGGGGGGPTS